MKTFTMTLLIVCAAIITSAIIFLNHQKGLSAQHLVADAPPSQSTEPSSSETAIIPPPQPKPVTQTNPPAQVAVASPSLSTAQTTSTNAVSPIHEKVQALLSAKSGAEKRAIFDELRKNGQLDAVIADLKQMAADNPNNAEIPTTIGEAELNEIRAIHEAGTDSANTDQMGILAMQADQEFSAALKIDPQNWEAQFVKDSSMYYWPADPQRDNQIVQSLSSLIDQQETMSANPDFAQTYLMLGNEYQKIGQPDKATATWQLGAQEYPGDSALQKKLTGQ
jgi:tetratricopeptide (TPR) repeat protein